MTIRRFLRFNCAEPHEGKATSTISFEEFAECSSRNTLVHMPIAQQLHSRCTLPLWSSCRLPHQFQAAIICTQRAPHYLNLHLFSSLLTDGQPILFLVPERRQPVNLPSSLTRTHAHTHTSVPLSDFLCCGDVCVLKMDAALFIR